MKRRQEALRLTVYLSQNDRVGETPAYVELVVRARNAGLAGATVVREVEGYGTSARAHGAPVVVTIVDRPEKVRVFAASVAGLTAKGLAILQAVEMIFPDNA